MVPAGRPLLQCGMFWLERKMTRLAALPWYLLFAHFVSRTMIGIGAGFLMAANTPDVHRQLFGGWFNLLVGLAIGIPSTVAVMWLGRDGKKGARHG
jgi:hypothetical protein